MSAGTTTTTTGSDSGKKSEPIARVVFRSSDHAKRPYAQRPQTNQKGNSDENHQDRDGSNNNNRQQWKGGSRGGGGFQGPPELSDAAQDYFNMFQGLYGRKGGAVISDRRFADTMNGQLIFQATDIQRSDQKSPLNTVTNQRFPAENTSLLPFDYEDQANTVVDFFGSTANGLSVCAHVHGFLPYFYIEVPLEFQHVHCNAIKDMLEKFYCSQYADNNEYAPCAKANPFKKGRNAPERHVISVELVGRGTCQNLKLPDRNTDHFVKVTVLRPDFVKFGRDWIERSHQKIITRKDSEREMDEGRSGNDSWKANVSALFRTKQKEINATYAQTVQDRQAAEEEVEDDNVKIIRLLDAHVRDGNRFAMPQEFPEFTGFFKTFESNLDFKLRYVVDQRLDGCPWLCIDGDKWQFREGDRKSTTCQIEVDLYYSNVKLQTGEQWAASAPHLLCSFDIECASTEIYTFPDATKDTVSHIACELTYTSPPRQYNGFPIQPNPIHPPEYVGPRSIVFTHKGCSMLPDAHEQVLVTRGERLMLEAFCAFIRVADPDQITGWNVNNFDFPYLLKRAKTLGQLEAFPYMTRLKRRPMRLEPIVMMFGSGANKQAKDAAKRKERTGGIGKVMTVAESIAKRKKMEERAAKLHANTMNYVNQDGNNNNPDDEDDEEDDRQSFNIQMPGRVVIDGLPVIKAFLGKKYRSYNLNAVADKLLGEQKADMPYHQIPLLFFNGSDDDRQRIASYCLKDAVLASKIVYNQNAIPLLIEMSRIAGVPIDDILKRGQSKKVFTMIYKACFQPHAKTKKKYLVPYHFVDDRAILDADNVIGATVIDAKKGFYTKPIATLDFASLYPSIMRAENLCYSTLVKGAKAEEEYLQQRDRNGKLVWEKHKSGCIFLLETAMRGICPTILDGLISLRESVKEKMTADVLVNDPHLYSTYNMQQLALKLSANSLYGFTGASLGSLPCTEITSTVTAQGRYQIEKVREYVMGPFSEKHGIKADVIYGDSVTPDTPIIWRNASTKYLHISNIEDLPQFTMISGQESPGWSTYHGDKQSITCEIIEVWTDKGWTRLNRIIRHKTQKNIVCVLTHTGYVKVTEDHSLLDENANKVTPNEVHVGQSLLHADLPPSKEIIQSSHATLDTLDQISNDILNAPKSIRQAFWDKKMNGHDRCDLVGQLNAQLYYALASSLGHHVTIKMTKDKSNIYRLTCTRSTRNAKRQRKNANTIKKLEVLGPTTDYVYDLETENHHFSAGVGRMIVHNTDSVMVNFGVPGLAEAKRLAEEVSADVSDPNGPLRFKKPNALAFEKIFFPYLLLSKKRYAGMKHEWIKDNKGIEKYKCYQSASGLETVRRDNCKLTAETVAGLLDRLLVFKDATQDKVTGKWIPPDYSAEFANAANFARGIVSDLYMNRVETGKLIITKNFSKEAHEYHAKQPHVELAQRMLLREKATAPRKGQRIPFVVTRAIKKDAKIYEKSEDPAYAIQHNLAIDAEYYLQQMKKPLLRILRHVLGGELEVHQSIFNGAHTQQQILPSISAMPAWMRPSSSSLNPSPSGSATKAPEKRHFISIEEDADSVRNLARVIRCMSCQTVLTGRNSNHFAICKTCIQKNPDQESIVYTEKMDKLAENYTILSRIKMNCLGCQGDYTAPVICSNSDCGIYYLRAKYTKIVRDTNEDLKRFDLEW